MSRIASRFSPTRTPRNRRRHPSVERLETRQLLSTYVVTSTADSGPGTLRRAINKSNGDTAQANLITFDLGTSSHQTISLLSALPTITQPVTIQGPTASDGSLIVELDGAGAGAMAAGLTVQADNTAIKNLIIDSFSGDGIDVSGRNDVIAGSHIGTPNASNGKGNGGAGVKVTGSNALIGGSAAGAENDISGNGGAGIWISGAGATGNVVQGNIVGLWAANGGAGVLVDSGASSNLIGTDGDGVNDGQERNVLSGNATWGVHLGGAGTDANVVAGNYIGTGPHGAAAVANLAGGVLVGAGASHNVIGTDGSSFHADEGNLISGNNGAGEPGIMISDAGTSFNVVAGNLIGTDVTGQNPIGNGGVGVFILGGARSNRVGTDGNGKGDASERNVIAANAYQGVYIGGAGTDDNVVAGNNIGVDGTGEVAMGNGNNGVWIADGARSNRIGANAGDADAAGEGNVLSANGFSGVTISDTGTDFNTVAGNFIGTDVNGTALLGNASDGVSIRGGAGSNTIGGAAGLGNFIRANGRSGVGVYDQATTGNSIRFNVMRGNGGLGIDLGGDGVTPDHGDTVAVGPNHLQNYPTITSAGDGTTTTVGISLVGVPHSTYTIDFYSSGGPDPSGYGEGFGYLGNVTVTMDDSGQAISPTTFDLSANTNPGAWITATATDHDGNTSEFSKAWQLSALSCQVTVTPSSNSAVYGQSLAFTANVGGFGTAQPTPTGTVQFLVDGQAFGAPVSLVGGAATSGSTHLLAAGDHTIGAAYSGDSNYTTFTKLGSQTISRATLTVRADDRSKVYGASDPGLTYGVTGLVNGDAPSVVSGMTLATATGPAATAGTHPITVIGGVAANYTVTAVNGTLSVTRAALTVRADDKSKVYGAADPVLTYTASGTLYYGDTYAVIGGVTLSTATDSAATAGIHAIAATGGTAANYTITAVDGALTVDRAPLIVRADDKSKVYGAADPVLTYTASGELYYGDTYAVINGVTLSTVAGAAATVGTHVITAAGGTAVNYAITDVDGTLTVTRAPDENPAGGGAQVTGPPPPPVVMTGVSTTLNTKHQVIQILITFSGALDAGAAQATASYRLATAGKKNSFDAKNAHVIVLSASAYDAVHHTVTLSPQKPFALKKPVQLRIAGQAPSGLQDGLGRLIDGDHDGQPGGNAIAVLGRKGVTMTASRFPQAVRARMALVKIARPSPAPASARVRRVHRG